MDVRVLTDAGPVVWPAPHGVRDEQDLGDDALDELYRAPTSSWLRVNMISTLDGAAAGADGLSGGINNAADHRVFECLRRLCDAVVVGAGTARAEGYADIARPLVLVSRRGEVPPRLRDAAPGRVLMATCAEAEAIDEAREVLGRDHVLVLGRSDVDLARLRGELQERELDQLLCEGGPHLLRDLVAARVLDELDLTLVPRLLAGGQPRILVGPPVGLDLRLRLVLEDQGTLLTRWTC